jgi:hypothetical protein
LILWDIDPAVKGGDHVTGIIFRCVSPTELLVVVDIRLFSAIETPSYHVVVGEVDLENPAHLAAWTKHNDDGRLQITAQQLPQRSGIVGEFFSADYL